MKNLIFGLLITSTFAHAEPLKVSVKNFNFTYKNPYGEGSASSFTRTKSLNKEEVRVMVEKIDKDLKFSVTGSENQEFELKDAPSFMTEAETMSVNSFNVSLADKLLLTLGAGRFNSRDDAMKIDGVTLDCARDQTKEEVMDQMLFGCIQRMILKSSKFSSQAVEESFFGILAESFSEALSDKNDLGINALDLRTSNGKYDLSADVKSSISGKIKSTGNMSYNPTTGKLTVRVTDVKFGILNITGKVFEELKKKENEKLQVKQPFVYYSLK